MATLIVLSSEAEEEEKEETEKEDQVDMNRKQQQQQQSNQKECGKKKKKNMDKEEDDDNDNVNDMNNDDNDNDTIGSDGEKEPEIISEEGKGNCQRQQQQQQHSKNNNDDDDHDHETFYNNNTEIDSNENNIFTGAYHTTNGQWEEKEDVKKKKKNQNNRTQKEDEEEERRRRCDHHNNGDEENDIPSTTTTTTTTTTDGVSTPSPSAAVADGKDGKDDYDCVKLKSTNTATISADTYAATVGEDGDEDGDKDEDEDEDKFSKLIFSEEKGNDVVGVKVEVDVDVVETNDDDENNNDNDDDDEQQLIKDARSYGAYVASSSVPMSPTSTISDSYNDTNTSGSRSASASATLAAIFGDEKGVAGGLTTSATNNGDYILVGNSPYETTYDPRSSYFYNRVYGHLYITTKSILFRGKAFGPIGAIPYERRLILPLREISRTEFYKTTSIRITIRSITTPTPTTTTTSMAVTTIATATATPPRLPLPSPRSFDDDDNDDNRNDDDAHSQLVATTPTSMKSSKTPIRKSTTHLRHGSSGTPVRSLHLSVVGDDGDGDGDSNDDNDDDEYYDVPLTGGAHENTDDTAATPAMTKTPQVQGMNNSNHTAAAAAAAGNDGDDDPATQPRRLFGSTENGASVNSIATSMMMMSPPRMMISQRRLPKTPAGNIGPPVNTTTNNDDTNNDTNTIGTAAAINNNSRSHLRQPLQLRQRSQRQRTGTMSIPTIPTVPTLNTPEPTKYLKKAIDIAMLNNIASRGNVDIPISITEIQEEEVAAAAAAAISSSKAAAAVAATENDLAVQQAWMERKKEGKSNNDDSEWKIAVGMTVLEQCTLDNWFDLFFSDDAHFSLQNYQIKDIGDKNVKYDSWTRKKKMKSSEDGGNDHVNAEDEESNKENINDSIPELERNITFMHPISGNLMGPSEAETFRLQTLKRYGSYGAILTNTTTVGKSVPMGDCFRVEDRWIIESTQSKLSNSTNNKNDKTTNDKYDSALVPQEALTLTVKFRVVFVKRTMFKSIITKNVISETKKWFIGYEKMMKVGLKSKVHTQTIQKRRQLLLENNTIQTTTTTSMSSRRSQEECRALSLPPSSNTMSAVTTSEEKILPEKQDDNLTFLSPSSTSVVVAANDEDEKVTLAMSRLSVLLDIFGALVRGIINTILSLPTMVSSKSIDGWYGERTAVAVMMITLLALFLLQMNYSSMRTSLTYIEEQLHNLHIQNAILLKRIEELSSVSLSSSSAAASATVE
ncbi:hypothetical protein FRACYDRAFT_238425 [Fragilariopsis cylindrus CCMP1102]|uniref:VASt domain-containing protein n=1 Tax=Fragilariopsis cylindrus CCMP1102 TaxID=635003 RepID=A0A1E7FIN4_9STRA|nr:hypothetical protein FRACYDRAFT_238425 [Fragilariopsis cylindrus CCMP1102]|eukprot:OEU17994.1 hypothetical protein FRACYDRAFT_238425 [Fragilariopsis cylindrus CCMP1102]